MMIHAGKCEWKDEFEVDRLLACEGHICSRKYLVRWKGYGADEDRWIPRSGIHPELIKEFEQTNGLYVEDWPHRCDVCDLPCQNAVGVKIHRTKAHKGEKTQNFKGTLASEAVKIKKLEKLQETRGVVMLMGTQLENVALFKYLGSLFAANGLQQRDIKARIAMAMTRCGQLSHLFADPNLGPRLKLRLYKVAVCSLLIYGCESWNLSDKVLRQINGANSSMLARFTGQTQRQEARRATTSYDLVRHIRVMRLKWLGFIMRQVDVRLIRIAIDVQTSMNLQGNILMDAPKHNNLNELTTMAKDEAFWSEHIKFI